MADDLGFSFERTLIEDVIAATERCSASDTQASRRDLVRATFAAIEGLMWIAREIVRDAGEASGEIDPLAAMALREASYQVDASGTLSEQIRHISLPAMTRFLIEQTKLLEPDFAVDFDEAGWPQFRAAIGLRNRLTHPKSRADLHIDDSDLATTNRGFQWFLVTSVAIMSTAHAAHAAFVRDSWELLEQLKSGDPDALARYRAQLAGADEG